MAKVSHCTRIKIFYLQLEHGFIKIKQSLYVTYTGKLSTGELPPHNLSQILQHVALRFPNDATLIAGTNLQDIVIYYEVA